VIRLVVLIGVVIAVAILGYRAMYNETTMIKAFTSDGCSAWPDGTLVEKDLWQRCCTAHDKSYWQGGTYAERKSADEELKTCVAAVGKPAVAAIMLAGVRVGGSPWWPTAFRWGYGWPWLRGYRPISSEDQTRIDAVLTQ